LKVLVTGAGGLVGRAVTSRFTSAGENVVALDHRELDISSPQSVRTIVKDTKPDVLINCAAWTDVDGCESDPAHAQAANGLGPELLASACREFDARPRSRPTMSSMKERRFYTQDTAPTD
jgi:dTDP-4-dehydrorhamnose reductase